MKLLPKKQVAASLSQQRKEDIDRGVALAGKVDAVRETLSKEEKRLEEFRTLSVAHVQTEIDARLREKNGIEREVMFLHEQANRLREPLDAEWRKVRTEAQGIEELKKTLLQKKHDLNEGINLNIRRERLNGDETQRIETLRLEAGADRELALDAKKTAQRELAEARRTANSLVTDAREREEVVSQRELSVQEKERAAKEQEKKLTKWAKDLENREEKLRINQQILIRSKAYINKK